MKILCQSDTNLISYDKENNKLSIKTIEDGMSHSLRLLAEESINKRYGERIKEDIPNRKIFIDDKGNLIFQISYLKKWLTDVALKRKLKQFHKNLKQVNESKRPLYKKIKEKKSYYLAYRSTCFIKNKKDVKFFSIASFKIIIKKTFEIYCCYDGKVRRIKAQDLLSKKYMQNWIFFLENLYETEPSNRKNIDKIIVLLSEFNSNTKYLLEKDIKIDVRTFRKIIDFKKMDFNKKPMPKSILLSLKKTNTALLGYFTALEIKLTDINVIRNFCLIYSRDISSHSLKKYYNQLCIYYANKNENIDLIFYNRIKILFDNTKKNSLKRKLAQDSLSMVNQVFSNRSRFPGKNLQPLKPNLLKKGLDDMHNYLSRIVRDDLAKIYYKEYTFYNFSKFEKNVDGYHFLMPKNSLELARIATIFDNCVAGYNLKIKSSSENIIYGTPSQEMIDYIQNDIGDPIIIRKKMKEEKQYPVCIEICKQLIDNKYERFYVSQNLSFNNQNPNSKVKKITAKYFKSVEVYETVYYSHPNYYC